MASRLIMMELIAAENALRHAHNDKSWWEAEEDLATDSWKEYNNILAPHVSYKVWGDLWVAMRHIERANRIAARSHSKGKSEPYIEKTTQTIAVILNHVELAREALSAHLI